MWSWKQHIIVSLQSEGSFEASYVVIYFNYRSWSLKLLANMVSNLRSMSHFIKYKMLLYFSLLIKILTIFITSFMQSIKKHLFNVYYIKNVLVVPRVWDQPVFCIHGAFYSNWIKNYRPETTLLCWQSWFSLPEAALNT